MSPAAYEKKITYAPERGRPPNRVDGSLTGLVRNLAASAMDRHFWVRLWAEQVGLR
jgi:hypothetical protein